MVISHLVRRRYDNGDDTHKKTFSVGQARSVHNQILFIRPTCHLGASHLLFRAGCLVYFDREQHNVQIIYFFFLWVIYLCICYILWYCQSSCFHIIYIKRYAWMHIILNVVLSLDKIKPSPTEWIALTDNLTWIQVKLTMTLASLLTTTTKLIIWVASILQSHTQSQTVTVNLCLPLVHLAKKTRTV